MAAPVMEYDESEHETKWLNPTDRDVVLDLHIGTNPFYSNNMKRTLNALSPEQRRESITGLRRYIFKAGDTTSMPREFDRAIQQTRCCENGCGSNPLYCDDLSHHREVVGGYGPQLINLRWKNRPVLHASFRQQSDDDVRAELNRTHAAWPAPKLAPSNQPPFDEQKQSAQKKLIGLALEEWSHDQWRGHYPSRPPPTVDLPKDYVSAAWQSVRLWLLRRRAGVILRDVASSRLKTISISLGKTEAAHRARHLANRTIDRISELMKPHEG